MWEGNSLAVQIDPLVPFAVPFGHGTVDSQRIADVFCSALNFNVVPVEHRTGFHPELAVPVRMKMQRSDVPFPGQYCPPQSNRHPFGSDVFQRQSSSAFVGHNPSGGKCAVARRTERHQSCTACSRTPAAEEFTERAPDRLFIVKRAFQNDRAQHLRSVLGINLNLKIADRGFSFAQIEV